MLIFGSTASEQALTQNTTGILDQGVNEADLPCPILCSGRAATFMWHVKARFETLYPEINMTC